MNFFVEFGSCLFFSHRTRRTLSGNFFSAITVHQKAHVRTCVDPHRLDGEICPSVSNFLKKYCTVDVVKRFRNVVHSSPMHDCLDPRLYASGRLSCTVDPSWRKVRFSRSFIVLRSHCDLLCASNYILDSPQWRYNEWVVTTSLIRGIRNNKKSRNSFAIPNVQLTNSFVFIFFILKMISKHINLLNVL